MATDTDRLRHTVESILKEDKSLNERDVKTAVGKVLKMKPADIGAGVIREVRRKLGIDRPSALAWARALLTKAPTTEARVIIEGPAAKANVLKPEVVDAAPKKGRGKAAKAPEPVVVPGPAKGEVSVTFQGRGNPEDLARFFLSLSKTL